jgi:hypothetical protein
LHKQQIGTNIKTVKTARGQETRLVHHYVPVGAVMERTKDHVHEKATAEEEVLRYSAKDVTSV